MLETHEGQREEWRERQEADLHNISVWLHRGVEDCPVGDLSCVVEYQQLALLEKRGVAV